MKCKKSELLTIVLFCGFLAVMMALYLFLPKADFSEREKRYLAEAPALLWEDVASGQWGSDAESYMADHIPGRDFFVGLNAYYDLLSGRQKTKDIWLAGDSRLVEAPVVHKQSAIDSNMSFINRFAETVGQDVDLMIVPSAGWACGLEGYADSRIIQDIYGKAGNHLRSLDVTEVFANRPDLYFKTDHHWNSAGAYAAYESYMTSLGRTYPSEEAFEKNVCGQFQGSTYSRSALWLTGAEDLELWTGSDNLTVTNGESEQIHQGVFYPERLEEADKYTVFLDGNHSIVRIQNPDASGKLLVIRDSYSNSLGCFLAESYAEVILVDLRYYRQPVSQLVAEEAVDDILVCYSLSNFLTDVNIMWLK